MLCGDWLLRNSEVNDHADADYDAAVFARLVDLDGRAQPILISMTSVLDRLAWMELYEDLILTQGIDRSAEGSF